MRKLNLLRKTELTAALILIVNAMAGHGSASTVSAVSCSSPGAPFSSNSSSCNALGTNGFASAGASSSVALPTISTQPAIIDAAISASALQTTFHGLTATATATSAADIGIIFNTEGPVRNGLLELNFNQLNWTSPVNGQISESLAIGGYNATLNGADLISVWIPIQLGNQFGFEYKQSVMAISSSISGLTTAAINAQISLLAFESDGVTAVQLFDPPGALGPSLFTPEPATFGAMLTAAAMGLTFLRKQRR